MTLFPAHGESLAPRLAPHQLEAVAWLRGTIARRGGALLADAAGLGKSWVAAALASGWEERGGAVSIVVPASLIEQWREIVATFGLSAGVVSHDGWLAEPQAAPGRARLLIVDEAHRFRNPRTRRYRRLATAGRRDALLLISATPFCNRPEDLRALFALIAADDALADRGVPSLDEAFRAGDSRAIRAVVDELALARDARVLPDALRFPAGERHAIAYDPARGRRRELEAALDRLRFPLVVPEGSGMLRALLWRRLESSAAALHATLRRLRRLHARALECATRGVRLGRAGYRAAFGDPDAPIFQDVLFPELWGARAGGAILDAASIRLELEALDAAAGVAGALAAADPKCEAVARAVEGMGGRRGLVFTQSRDSAVALREALRAVTRCGLVTGRECRDAAGAPSSMSAVLCELRRGLVDVVVATDVGSEGLNLQAAAYLVHADLPWTPAKLEQRLGRVSRIGQRSERVEEIVLVPERSSVVPILQRKAAARSRLASRRQGALSVAPVPDRLDAREVAARGEPLCVVDLVERRAGQGVRGIRSLSVDGRAGSLPDGRALAAQMESDSWWPAHGRDAAVERVVEEWVGVARAREAQPARIDAHAPQTRLLAAAARAGVVTRELVELMSRRYRAGSELLIADLAAAGVDGRAVATLARELGAEAVGPSPYEATVAGFRATRGWLRSAARLRGGRR